jgi:hypothetical protein
MTGTALWFAFALAVLATALLDAAATFGRASLQITAARAVDDAAHDALAGYQNRLGAAIATSAAALQAPQPFAGAPPDLGGYAAALATLPNPLTIESTPDPAQPGPQFHLSARIVPTTLAPPACSSAPPAGPDTIAWLQCNGVVQESRASIHLTVDAFDQSGTQLLAERDQYLTLRLFAVPPYSIVVGRKDGAAGEPVVAAAGAPAPHEGDAGGDTTSGVVPPSASPWPAGGTLIHVRYDCTDDVGHCANAAPPDPDASLEFGRTWSNGNRPPP